MDNSNGGQFISRLNVQSKKTGLVLSGGGTYGSYELGVWMALRDLEIEQEISGVSGTSIGALNAALYAQGDIDLARNIWLNVTSKDVVPFNWAAILNALAAVLMTQYQPMAAMQMVRHLKPDVILKLGFFSQRSLERIINEKIKVNSIAASPLDLYACCCKINGLNAEYFSLKQPDLKSILLASAAIPAAFPTVTLRNQKYCDGGLKNNTPIKPLYNIGYRRFIAVSMSPNKEIKLDDFADAEVILIRPKPSDLFKEWSVTEVLTFKPYNNFLRMCEGYHDALKTLISFKKFYSDNLFESRGSLSPASFGCKIVRNDGFEITVFRIFLGNINNKTYILADTAITVSTNAVKNTSYLLLIGAIFVAFSDGSRSYPDANVSDSEINGNKTNARDTFIKIPVVLENGGATRGLIAFEFNGTPQEFILMIAEYQSRTPTRNSRYFYCRA